MNCELDILLEVPGSMPLNIANLELRKEQKRESRRRPGWNKLNHEKLNLVQLDGNSRPRDSHLTTGSRAIFIMAFAAEGRKMSSADVYASVRAPQQVELRPAYGPIGALQPGLWGSS